MVRRVGGLDNRKDYSEFSAGGEGIALKLRTRT